MSVSLFYIFVTSWAWMFKNIKVTSFISTHTHIQGGISVLYKSLLSWAKGMFNLFVRIFILFKLVALHKSNNGSIDLCIWGLSSLGFDLHRKFIEHYERCILVPYSHSCQVKFKSVPNILFEALHSNTCTHTFTHKFARTRHRVLI